MQWTASCGTVNPWAESRYLSPVPLPGLEDGVVVPRGPLLALTGGKLDVEGVGQGPMTNLIG